VLTLLCALWLAAAAPEQVETQARLAHAALQAGRLDQAESFAGRALEGARQLAGSLASNRQLARALGAAIEVRAEVLARSGRRAEAIRFLRLELAAYPKSTIEARIRKNLNLLTLEGRPAPPLEVSAWIGAARPQPLAALGGHPVLLFFWAHWCSDCKAELPVIAKVRDTFGPRGLRIVAPTQLYGYVARGEEAAPADETRYIEQVWRTVYAPLAGLPVPLSEHNFALYGSSTVPTEVLLDRQGIVRLYHPDVMPYSDLAAAIEQILR
jgi:thiol-disulfide isomerase/thioredoxin